MPSNGFSPGCEACNCRRLLIKYVSMRAILPSLALLLLPGIAHAMNWEGHDDWMADMEPAVIYEKSAPHASPRPQQGCTAGSEEARDNPYEQIPLDRRDCPALPPGGEGER
jgi:hypothetical protein